jgi:diguanylate cyclase (GGDEF)-like protein/PAS domain S-box-containing protein
MTPPATAVEHAALSRLVFDSVTEYAIFTITAQGDVATWNRGAERAFGYTAAEIIGTSFAVIFSPDDRAAGLPAAEMRAASERGRLDRDCWHVRKDGSRFWGTNTVQPLVDGDGKRHGFTKIVRDSTERYEAALALRQSEERFRLLVESIEHYAMFAIAPDGLITLWNTGAQRTYGYSQAEMVGESFARLFTADEVAGRVPELELRRAAAYGQVDNERWQLRSDGSRFMAHRRVTRLHVGALGAARGFSVTAHDVTRDRAVEKTMWRRAFHDALTGLPNRALFIEHAQRTIAHAKRDSRFEFAVLFLDIDRFKQINDEFGHALADDVLRRVGKRLSACVRPEDVIARIGGDEFAVLVSAVPSLTPVVALTDRIHGSLETAMNVAGHAQHVSTSIGVAMGTFRYDRPEELLRDADIAMYLAKSRGRANTAVFEERMRAGVMPAGDARSNAGRSPPQAGRPQPRAPC